MKQHRVAHLIGALGIGIAGLSGTGVLAPSLLGGSGTAGATTPCFMAGTTGLTAAVVATSGAILINGTVDATGCDIGIYVGPTASSVTIAGETVSGANDEGIFVEQTTGVSINHSTIRNNEVNPSPSLASDGGITLAGVSNSSVDSNTVTGNNGGGIYVVDNGPIDPGAPNPGPATPVPATNVVVSNNTLTNNPGGCGIIYATHNTGGSVVGGSISGNSITGSPGVFTKAGPDVGGIVVAAASAGATVSNVSITGNTVAGSYEGGIIVHAHAPHDSVTGTTISNNTLPGGNNWGRTNGPPATAGVIIGVDLLPPAIAPTISGTVVSANTISGHFYGIWISGVPAVTTTPANTISVNTGGTDIYRTPVPGTGYWLGATDGGIFNYGSAGFNGSAGSIKLNKPIVGMAATQDQGGYWLVASDGGIFTYGDAPFFGSAGSIKLNKPIVGMAATPYVPGAGGAPAAPSGLGYWLVASDGGIFTYGDAGFFGSAGSIPLNKPIVGMAATPDGKGYWLVASDGGIFTYGDAGFFGSAGSIKLNKPIVGMAATPDGEGYWLVASDGGIFTYGDAGFFGSAGSIKLNKPIVGMAATPDGKGYWLAASDGGIFTYGDAGFFGSAGSVPLNQPVIGMAAVGATASG